MLHVHTQERERYPHWVVPRFTGGRIQNYSRYGQVLLKCISHRPRELTRFFWEVFVVPADHLHFIAAAKVLFGSLDDR